MRRRVAAAGAAGLAVVAAGAGIAAGTGSGDGAAAEPAAAATATTEIRRRDLVEREEVDGTLGFSDARPAAGLLRGTLTWLPAEGRLVEPGGRLFDVDGEPVLLIDGTTPAWRDLAPGTRGTDVRQLERTLREIDADPDGAMDVDGVWDTGTTAAVRRLQRRRGLADDGVLELGRVVVAPGRRRVGTRALELGATVGGGAAAVLTTTSTRRVVTVDLEADRQELARAGAAVEVELPGGRDVAGTVLRVGRVAETQQGADGSAGDPTVEVTVRLRRATRLDLDGAPVDVRFERARARDVLTVPVTALLARAGGGFAVELREGDRRRVVPVQTGTFADGDVEIRGAGLRPGQRVTDARV
jgi:peptidoglycan hydrolase-like protein with peptidoglycan-binding domain